MSTDAMGYIIAGLAGLVSFLGFRTAFPLVKFGACVLWVGAFMFFRANAPAGTEGEPWHVVFLLGAVVMALAIPLAQLGRAVEKRQGYGNAFDMKSIKWQWGSKDAPERGKGLNDNLDEYRERMERALRNK
jgi:hypothetical protein